MTALDYLLEYCERENWSIPFDVEHTVKEMEKEQIVKAHYQGYRETIGTTEVSEDYYNETYGGNK